MNKTTIKAEIVADSLSPQGDRLTSLLITFPRFILAEVNTHRMLSKNTSSSRAIPFNKMVEAVKENPFVPIAWQKYHSGMQGVKYLDDTVKYDLITFMAVLEDTLSFTQDEKERDKLRKRLEEKIQIIKELLTPYISLNKTLSEWWLFARDKAVEAASILYVFDVTKQLCNRLLEPFMWTTMLITGSKEGWDNFFHLRCPSYELRRSINNNPEELLYFKSKKDYTKEWNKGFQNDLRYTSYLENQTDLDWLLVNKGQAEIHMMDLAEKIYDAMNESSPKQLQAGEWHIPFEDKIDLQDWYNNNKRPTAAFWNELEGYEQDNYIVKVSTAMAARTSYTVVGDEKEIDYSKMIELHDRLIAQKPPHSSPLEHCARVMSDDEYYSYLKTNGEVLDYTIDGENIYSQRSFGWCGPYKGFISYRHIIDNTKN